MIKYQFVIIIFLNFFTAVTAHCQIADSIENISDSERHFNAPLTQGVNIPEKLRRIPKQQIDRFLRDADYAYANDSAYWRTDPPPKEGPVTRFLSGKIFQWIFFLAIVAIVLFGLYRLALENNMGGFFGRWVKSVKTPDMENPEGEPENLDLLISKYQSEGNYRHAIRYLYLRLIKTAIESRHIQIGESSTNAVIARGFKNQKESADFQYLATAFEYVFYGGFSPAYPVYENLKSKFDRFQETLLN
jgi:hypothetical protein